MREDYNGDLYDVYYTDGNGKGNAYAILDTPKEMPKDCLTLRNVLGRK